MEKSRVRPGVWRAIFGILILLEAVGLVLAAFLVTAEAPGLYETLATVNITALSDIPARCEQVGCDPLYPMLLYLVLRLLPAGAGQHGSAILHLALAAVHWLLLWCLSRRMFSRRAATLPPLVFSVTAAFLAALTEPTPTLLLMTLAAALALFFTVHLSRPIRTMDSLLFFALVLLGILTEYGFFFAAMAFSLPYLAVSLLRRRTSDGVTPPVLTSAALLAAMVLHPDSIRRTAALFSPGQFAAPYGVRVSALLASLADRLFFGRGVGITIAVVTVLLVIAAAVMDAMRPKKDEDAPADAPADPSRAAYQRRIARRTARLPRRVTLSRAQGASLLLLATAVLALLLLPLYPRADLVFPALDLLWFFLLFGALHYAYRHLKK